MDGLKGQQADDLVNFCGKMACKAEKITAYVIVYETKKGVIHTQRSGSAAAQAGLTKVAESNIMRCFTVPE